MGVGGFIVSMTAVRDRAAAGLNGWIGGALTFGLFAIFRAIYGSLGCATPSRRRPISPRRPGAAARVAALSALSSSFGLGTIIGPAVAPCSCCRSSACRAAVRFALIALVVFVAILCGCPTTAGARSGGAAMSYPSLASPPTGASVVAATAPKRAAQVERPAHPPWIIAGVVAGHAQAAC
jgi:hypothetical protein